MFISLYTADKSDVILGLNFEIGNSLKYSKEGYVFIVKKKGTTEKSIQYNTTTPYVNHMPLFPSLETESSSYIVHCDALISKLEIKVN